MESDKEDTRPEITGYPDWEPEYMRVRKELEAQLAEAVGLLEDAHTMLTRAITIDNLPEDIQACLTKHSQKGG